MTAQLLREELSAVLERFDVHDREPFLNDIRRLYADDVFFRDPMQQAKGLSAFLGVNERMGKGAKQVRFTVHDSTGDDALFYLHWRMRFVPRLGPALSVEGVSRIRAEGRRVIEHVDYWDLGELFASALPFGSGRKLLHLVFKPFV